MIASEDVAKKLLAGYGLHVPPGRVAMTPAEAATIASELGGVGVVKALIPAGGRGKAGGVRVCSSVEAVREAASALLGQDLLGYPVQRVLIEKAMPVALEMYASVVVNPTTSLIDLMISLAGGMEIENTAQQDKATVLRLAIEPGNVLPIYRVRTWLQQANLEHVDVTTLADVLVRLYRAAADLDSMLLEINPLAILRDGSIVLLDCKLEIDDNGLARQPELSELHRASLSERERRARELGVSFVPLDGDIGVITSGAGLGMATLDLLKQKGLTPANFLDTGGAISEPLIQGALELIMDPANVRGAIVNLYGGINRMLEASQGIVAALKCIQGNRPIVVKILGNQQEAAWEMLATVPNIYVIREVQTEVAVAKLAELVG